MAGTLIFVVAALANQYTCRLLLRGAVASATCDYETLSEAIAGPGMRVRPGQALGAGSRRRRRNSHPPAYPTPAGLPACRPLRRAWACLRSAPCVAGPCPAPPQWAVEISTVLLLLGTTAGGIIQIGGAAAQIVLSYWPGQLAWWTDNNGTVGRVPLEGAVCRAGRPCRHALAGRPMRPQPCRRPASHAGNARPQASGPCSS